jgi:hypothetical protein
MSQITGKWGLIDPKKVLNAASRAAFGDRFFPLERHIRSAQAQAEQEAIQKMGPKPNMKDIATKEMGLNEQEQFLYQHHLDNYAKGGVKQPTGETSTIKNITVESDGKTFVIPTVWDNKIVSNDQAIKNADAAGFDKFPSYGSEEEANARYNAMHDYMEKDIQ